jgi:hypothetical protein
VWTPRAELGRFECHVHRVNVVDSPFHIGFDHPKLKGRQPGLDCCLTGLETVHVVKESLA